MIQVVGLLVAGVGVENGVLTFERSIPRAVYFEPSFTLALLSTWQWLLVPVLLFAAPLFWRRSERLSWQLIDSVGGFRWAVLAVAFAISWSYFAHPVNHYFGQNHSIDRWLLLGTTLALLRSPALLPLFLMMLAICRAQLRHPIGSLTPIGDEFPLRLLGMITTAVLLNLLARTDTFARLKARVLRTSDEGTGPIVSTPALVFATLCLVGGYYGYAGYAKLAIGETPIDWVMSSHLENLFVGTYLKGWQWIGDTQTLLEWAPVVATVAPYIAAITIVLEVGFVFVLVHRRGTIVLLTGIMGMHIGIVALSGIFFWKWVSVDLALGCWLWWVGEDEGIRSIYSRSNAAISVVAILGFISVFGLNEFTWWNTKRLSVLEVHARGSNGSTCVVESEAFSPYMLVDYMRPKGALADTFGFGSTFNQKLMERTESVEPIALRDALRRRRAENASASRKRAERSVDDFMQHYFSNRNRRAVTTSESNSSGDIQHVFPFVFSAPLIHMKERHNESPPQCTAPIVEVTIRNILTYFTGETLVQLENMEIHRVTIPRERDESKF